LAASPKDLPINTLWGIDCEIEFYEFYKFLKFTRIYTNFKTVNFKIHKIQIINFIAAKFQQTLCRKYST